MSYLKSTRMDPSGGAGHMPWWQFMLQRQPEKLAGLLSVLTGRKSVSLGKPQGAPGSTRRTTSEGETPSTTQVGSGGFVATSPRHPRRLPAPVPRRQLPGI